MLRRASVLALVVTLASGCTLTREGRRGTILTGTVVTAASVLLISSGSTDSNGNGVNENPLNDDWGAYMLGTGLFLAGLGILAVGLASDVAPEMDPVTYAPPVPAPPPPPPTLAAPDATQIVEVSRLPVAPLPELPATADVLRLAKQVRSAATHGRCDAAWIMWIDLQKLDAGYAVALRDGPVMAGCAM